MTFEVIAQQLVDIRTIVRRVMEMRRFNACQGVGKSMAEIPACSAPIVESVNVIQHERGD